MLATVSPKNWGINDISNEEKKKVFEYTGYTYDELEKRWNNATYKYLLNNYDEETGAIYGHYDPKAKVNEKPNLTNLIAPLQFLAVYDKNGDRDMLNKAKSCADFLYKTAVIWWPMHMWQGGVKDTGEIGGQVWVKYTAEILQLFLAIYNRTGDQEYLRRAKQNATFLKQAQRHEFKFTFDLQKQEWQENGWKSFGRVIEALIGLYSVTKEEKYLKRAKSWADYGLNLQAPNGCFYLIDDYFYNTDIAPNEIRGLTYLYEITGDKIYLDSAKRYADWHIEHQRADGGWLLALDRDDEVVCDVVGPGDPANIAISMLRLHYNTGDRKYLDSAIKALKYSIKMQAAPGCLYDKYLDDPKVLWGFWSWEPTLDWTVCGDQSVHHVRAMMFVADYISRMLEN